MRDGDPPKAIGTNGARDFLGAGALNALLTLALYQLLLFFLSPEISYATAWGVSLAVVALAVPQFVFRASHLGWQGHAAVALIYLTVFLLGMGVLRTVIDFTGMERLAIFAAVPASVLFNFLGMHVVFRPARSP